MTERAAGSEYMEWAKTRSQARFNLASSGVADLPLSALPFRREDLELTGPSFYGWPPLQARLAAKAGVSADQVVAATGTSMANHLALAALLQPGDEALIEQPAYGPLVDTARYLGAVVRRFPRLAQSGFAVEAEAVERELTPRTRAIVLTNLHNPSSAFTGEALLRRVGEAARSVGARVLVDEVYLDARFDRAPASCVHLGAEFVATGSLTKAYGLSGLRCGWILAQPDLARKIWRLNDLFGVVPAHPAERLSVVALDHLDGIAARARVLLEANRGVLQRFLDDRPELEAPRLEAGMVAFPRLRGASADEFCARLGERYETTVVPGRFFGAPEHFRISYGCPPETLAGGLERMAAALDDLR